MARRCKGSDTRRRWDLFDVYSQEQKATSMSRCTAIPCAIFGRLLLEGLIESPGVHPPEHFGANSALVDRVLAEHEMRGIRYRAS